MTAKKRPRDQVLPDKPFFTRAEIAPRQRKGKADEEVPRIDGVSARGQLSGLRPDRIPSVHHEYDMTVVAEVCAVGVWIWEARDRIEASMPAHDRGRRREYGIADALLYPLLASIYRSNKKVERFLKRGRNWRRLMEVVAAAWPDDPRRRLGDNAPSRFQFYRLRRNHIAATEIERLLALLSELAYEQAVYTGLFDERRGKAFEPDKRNMAVSDGTWELAQTNATDEPYFDRTTGKVVHRRRDPDAYKYRDNSKPYGNMLVFLSAPGALPGTSVILSTDYTAGRHEQDSDVAVRMAIEAKKALPGLQGLAHDGSASAKHREECFANDMLLVNSLSHLAGKVPYAILLGEKSFKLKRGGAHQRAVFPVWAIDGHPCIEVHDGNEMVYLQLQRIRQHPRKRSRTGRTIVYADWAIPDYPLARHELRGATTMLRHNSTPDELAVNKLVSRHLLLISRYDPLYHVLYPTREFAESVNNAYKQTFINGRARSLGLKNRRLDVLGFMIVFNYESLLTWRKHTGGDISRWFGNYNPDD